MHVSHTHRHRCGVCGRTLVSHTHTEVRCVCGRTLMSHTHTEAGREGEEWWCAHAHMSHTHAHSRWVDIHIDTHTPISERWHSRYPNYNLYSNDFPTCFRKTWSCGCEAGSIVTSNRGRKMLSRRFWNDVTIPISLYTLYKRGICKTVKVKTFVFIVMLLSRSTVFRTSKPWLHGILHP